MSEDTYRGDLNDPKTLNYYTYGFNSPLRYIDSSGHENEDLESNAVWVAAEPFTIGPMSEMESLAWDLQQQYPGMEITALDDETIVIKTNECNKENIRIDAFGMELNGEEIIIRRTAVTVEGEIVGTNFFVQIKDDLFLSTANLTSNKDKSVIGAKANTSTTPVTLFADITVLRDGSVSADMWISFPDSNNEPLVTARIETPNGIIRTDRGVYANDAQGRNWIGPYRGKTKYHTYYPTITTNLDPNNDATLIFMAQVGNPEALLTLRYDLAMIKIALF